MGWSGALSASSAIGDRITFTPDTDVEGGYTVSAFSAPKAGVYRFDLAGSGGTNGSSKANGSGTIDEGNVDRYGGKGGAAVGYLKMKKGETVYIGAGGTCSAAFVSSASGASLAAVPSTSVYFVAGAGGAAGRIRKGAGQAQTANGGAGGGAEGAKGLIGNNDSQTGANGGTQTAGGQPSSNGQVAYSGSAGTYGKGGAGGYGSYLWHAWAGRGGDGWYGGAGGGANTGHNSATDAYIGYAYGGGGGSGRVHASSLTVLGKTYANATTLGTGAEAGSKGSVSVTYAARTLLPVFFDGTQLERIFFNGTELESLVHNGATVFIRRMKEFFGAARRKAGFFANGREAVFVD